MEYTITIIDDQPNKILEKMLKKEGYNVDIYDEAEKGIAGIKKNVPDLLLLDLTIPVKSGFEILSELIKLQYDFPIIIVSARDSIEEKVIGLEMGAVDYVTKPFHFKELIARIKVHLKRESLHKSKKSDVFKIGDLVIDFSKQEIKKDEENVTLTHYEYMILKCLVENGGDIVSRDTLIEQIWGNSIHVNSKTIDNHVTKLRKKIEKNYKKPEYIQTIYGRGYKFNLG